MILNHHMNNWEVKLISPFNVYIQRLQRIMIEVYTILNSIGPSYLQTLFTFKSSVYDLRNSRAILMFLY